jgi:hypothetical protein
MIENVINLKFWLLCIFGFFSMTLIATIILFLIWHAICKLIKVCKSYWFPCNDTRRIGETDFFKLFNAHLDNDFYLLALHKIDSVKE